MLEFFLFCFLFFLMYILECNNFYKVWGIWLEMEGRGNYLLIERDVGGSRDCTTFYKSAEQLTKAYRDALERGVKLEDLGVFKVSPLEVGVIVRDLDVEDDKRGACDE